MRRIIVIFFLVAIFVVGSVRGEGAEDNSRGEGTSQTIQTVLNEPAPLVVWNRTIRVFRISFKGFSPLERAERAKIKIENLAPRGDWEILTIEAKAEGMNGVLIGTKTGMLFGLLPDDLDPGSGQTLDTAAKDAVDKLKAVLDEKAAALHLSTLL